MVVDLETLQISNALRINSQHYLALCPQKGYWTFLYGNKIIFRMYRWKCCTPISPYCIILFLFLRTAGTVLTSIFLFICNYGNISCYLCEFKPTPPTCSLSQLWPIELLANVMTAIHSNQICMFLHFLTNDFHRLALCQLLTLGDNSSI